jgi:hypothetical protein
MEESIIYASAIPLAALRMADFNTSIYQERNDQDLRKLANDIKRGGDQGKRDGLLNPLNVSEDLVIFDGNSRYLALTKYSDRKTVKCNIHLGLDSGSEEFKTLLVSANLQRIKTTGETLRECAINADGVLNFHSYMNDHQEADDLEVVNGSINERKKLNQEYDREIIQAISKVLNDLKRHWPVTLRYIHYQLVMLPNAPIISKKDGRTYQNIKKDYDKLSVIIAKMRCEKLLSMDALRDDQRKVTDYQAWPSKEAFIRHELDSLFKSYDRDLMQGQPEFIAIVCEKETVSQILEPLNYEYNIPIYYVKGTSSLTIRYKFLKHWQAKGKRNIKILFITDLDPAGLRIQDSFIGSLKQDFSDMVQGYKVTGRRIGITLDQVQRYNIATTMKAKKSDKQHKDFLKRTGQANAYELEALQPGILREVVKEAIISALDMEAFNREKELYHREASALAALKKQALQQLGKYAEE